MNRPAQKFISLESIRGIAALCVVVCHLQMMWVEDWLSFAKAGLDTFLPATLAGKLALATLLPFRGSLAVTIFWVLSGFVLTLRLWPKAELSQVAAAIGKRWFRLAAPVIVSVLLAWAILKSGLHWEKNMEGFATRTFAAEFVQTHWTHDVSFLQAMRQGLWDTFINYDAALKRSEILNPPLWTIGPEFVGSILVFVVAGLFSGTRARWLIYSIIIVIAGFAGSYAQIGTPFGGVSYLGAFVVGMALRDFGGDFHHLPFPKGKARLGVHIGLVALLFLEIPFGMLQLPVAALLIYLALADSDMRRLLEWKPVAWLGRISFSLYLVHISVQFTVGCGSYLFMVKQLSVERWLAAILASGLSIAVALVLANAMTQWLDEPWTRLVNRVTKQIVLWFQRPGTRALPAQLCPTPILKVEDNGDAARRE